MDVLVSPEWLVDHLDEVVVADVRWYLDGRSGHDAYENEHIAGAVFVDLDADLSDHGTATAGRHPLPSPDAFAAAMGALGIADHTPVVAYDDSGGGTAGRLVWMLRATGHDAALLDGGLRTWTGARAAGVGAPLHPVAFTPRPWPAERLADADAVAAVAASGAAGTAGAAASGVVLDARAADRFRGDHEPVDPRAGHIPGARNANWQAAIDPETGRFRSPAALRAHFEGLGVRDGGDVIAYCGSGVSACANLVALEHAGFAGARLFVASWSGWSSDPARPVATGDA